jgi:ADP-ribose pyrophosphatase YjhB (NUDIX family)
LSDRRLDWVRRLRAVAQNGLTYTESPFDRERYEEIRALAAEIAAADGGATVAEVARAFADDTGYATPKLDVRAAAFRDDRVLLVRARDDGLWSLPGGWAEVGESPRMSVEKELLEETGHAGSAVRLIGLCDHDLRSRRRHPAHVWKAYFLCELADGEPQPPHAVEIEEIGFFSEDEVPGLSDRTPPEHLALAFAHARDPARPPDFD